MEEILHKLGSIRYLWNTVNDGIVMEKTIYQLVQDFFYLPYHGDILVI